MTQLPSVSWFPDAVDLASAALGGRAVAASDDFFAPMERLIAPEPPVFDPDAYTDRGKLMDGWESRRKRVPGSDWCIVRLGVPGRVVGVVFDTSHFLGNHAPFASLEGAVVDGDPTDAAWRPLVASTPLVRGGVTVVATADSRTVTHVRLHMHPDGGIARLRVFGHPDGVPPGGEVDLASASVGARTLACSDAFFSPMGNLLLPSRSGFMGGGWETRRSRPPGRDWIVVQLGSVGAVRRIVLDTGHFKGNYPDRAAVDGLCWPGAAAHALVEHADWRPITECVHLSADCETEIAVHSAGPWSHLRLRIEPDGGVARLRAFGVPVEPVPEPWVARVNALPADEFRGFLVRCCSSPRWAEDVVAARPFATATQLLGEAERLWWAQFPPAWEDGLRGHPRIGGVDALRARFAATAAWSEGESAAAATTDEGVLAALAAGNDAYEARYGWPFVIDATGRSASDVLAAMGGRMHRAPDAERAVGAAEVWKIARRRIQSM
jgi:allantoicase